MHNYPRKTLHGEIPIHVMAPEKFGGEFEKRSHAYIGALWLVSAWAATTNLSQALLKKISRNNGDSLGRILWDMGRNPRHVSSMFVDRFSRHNHQAKYGAAGWRSLELFYNYHEKVAPQLDGDLEGNLTHHWGKKLENRQPVTNRLKIVVDLLAKAFTEFADEKEIRLLSVASGSAQAVIAAMKRTPHLTRCIARLNRRGF